MAPPDSLSQDYFDQMYAVNGDPWSFENSEYEAGKYATTIQLLGTRRFGSALEIGCSIGVLTEKLAAHCDALLAVDIAPEAVRQAAERTDILANVTVTKMAVPTEFPHATFSLIVVSEVGYYWNTVDELRTRDAIAQSLDPGGLLVLVHYLPKVEEYLSSGDDVHERYIDDPRFLHHIALRKPLYRADTFSPAG